MDLLSMRKDIPGAARRWTDDAGMAVAEREEIEFDAEVYHAARMAMHEPGTHAVVSAYVGSRFGQD